MIWSGDDPIDEVLVIPRSGHPDESFEICCHSGAAVARAIVSLFVSLGARHVPWSRLIAAGTLEYELTEALLSAEGPAQALCLAELLGGSLRDGFLRLIDGIENREENDCADLIDDLARLRGTFSIGRYLSVRPVVAITGPPNAGKSTLFNAIAGESRALTSPFRGTTRDPVETVLILEGFPVRLIDTAGNVPNEEDPLDLEGAMAAQRIASGADLEIRVVPWDAIHESTGAGRTSPDSRVLDVVNKCDLSRGADHPPRTGFSGQPVSALLGSGIGALLDSVSARLGLDRLVDSKGPLLVTQTQCDLVDTAIDNLSAGRSLRPLLDAMRDYAGPTSRSQPYP